MKPLQKTTGTKTRTGTVPHIEVAGDCGMFLAPVKLDFAREVSTVDRSYYPLKRGGRFVYALPGGGEIVA